MKLGKTLYLLPKDFGFQNAFQITSYQPHNLYCGPSELAPSIALQWVPVLSSPELHYRNEQCKNRTIHARWSSSCGACHLPREAGALDSLWPFFYLVLITASVECHHLASARFNMVSCTNKNKRWDIKKSVDTSFFLISSALNIAL